MSDTTEETSAKKTTSENRVSPVDDFINDASDNGAKFGFWSAFLILGIIITATDYINGVRGLDGLMDLVVLVGAAMATFRSLFKFFASVTTYRIKAIQQVSEPSDDTDKSPDES